jgi:hypothetical protein
MLWKSIPEDMIYKYIFYEDSNKLRCLIRSLGKYNRTAYKQVVFKDRFEELEFKQDGEVYKADLITDKLFEQVYGKYQVVAEIRDKQIKVISIEPEKLLRDGYMKFLETYKGVPYRNKKDLFKILLAEKRIKDDI